MGPRHPAHRWRSSCRPAGCRRATPAAPSGSPAAVRRAARRSGEPPASGEPPPASGAGRRRDLAAHDIQFLETSFTAPADRGFTIAFDNQDPSIPHNVEIKDAAGTAAFLGEIFPGVETRVYDVPALPAGSYAFLCTVHPTMTGTATVQ